MDELVLLHDLKQLESAWASLDSWLRFWILLVVLGVAVELLVVIAEYFEERHDFMLGIVHPPHPPSSLLFLFGLIGAALVALGVAGEFAVHIKAGKIESDMRRNTQALVAVVNERAANADRDAAQAKERTAALELQLADRHIDLDQRKKIRNVLLGTSGTVAVTYLSGSTADSQEYALEIADLFRTANWKVVPFPWLTSYEVPVHGFAVQIRDKLSSSRRKLLERTLRQSLSVLDKRIAVTYGGSDPSSELTLDAEILVGSK